MAQEEDRSWRKLHSVKRDMPYWFNTVTGQSMWSPPPVRRSVERKEAEKPSATASAAGKTKRSREPSSSDEGEPREKRKKEKRKKSEHKHKNHHVDHHKEKKQRRRISPSASGVPPETRTSPVPSDTPASTSEKTERSRNARMISPPSPPSSSSTRTSRVPSDTPASTSGASTKVPSREQCEERNTHSSEAKQFGASVKAKCDVIDLTARPLGVYTKKNPYRAKKVPTKKLTKEELIKTVGVKKPPSTAASVSVTKSKDENDEDAWQLAADSLDSEFLSSLTHKAPRSRLPPRTSRAPVAFKVKSPEKTTPKPSIFSRILSAKPQVSPCASTPGARSKSFKSPTPEPRIRSTPDVTRIQTPPDGAVFHSPAKPPRPTPPGSSKSRGATPDSRGSSASARRRSAHPSPSPDVRTPTVPPDAASTSAEPAALDDLADAPWFQPNPDDPFWAAKEDDSSWAAKEASSSGSSSLRSRSPDVDDSQNQKQVQNDLAPAAENENTATVPRPSSCDRVEEMDVDPEPAVVITKDVKVIRSNLRVDPTEVLGSFTETLMSRQEPMEVSHCWQLNQQLFIVLDTNILMESWKIIDELKGTSYSGFGRPVCVIPWVVFQELDALKDKDLDKDVNARTRLAAGKAIGYLNRTLVGKDRHLIGQTPAQAIEKVGIEVEMNDDKVLQCCLQWRKMHANADVVLLTMDRNLQSKSIVNGIAAYDLEKLKEWLSSRRPRRLSSNGGEIGGIPKKSDMEPVLVDDLSGELRALLKESLSLVLDTEVRVTFDELAPQMFFRKPPWTLDDVLASMRKHWIGVFSHNEIQNIKEAQPHLERLYEHYRPGAGYGKSLRDIVALLRDGLFLVRTFFEHDRNNDCLDETIARLSTLIELCRDVIQKKKPMMNLASLERAPDDNASQISQPPSLPGSPENIPLHEQQVAQIVLDNFQAAWTFVHDTKGVIAFHLTSSSPGSSRRQEALNVFKAVIVALLPLKESFERALHSSPPDVNCFHELVQALHSLRAQHQDHIQMWHENMCGDHVLQFYLTSEDNQRTLSTGLTQLYNLIQEFQTLWTMLSPDEQAFVQP